MNAPDLYELYLMQPGEKKIKMEEKGNNVCNFILNKEDHTAGNLIRMKLLKNPNVIFAGYRQPHPLSYIIEITIRTNGIITPKEALAVAIEDILNDIKEVKEQISNQSHYYEND